MVTLKQPQETGIHHHGLKQQGQLRRDTAGYTSMVLDSPLSNTNIRELRKLEACQPWLGRQWWIWP